ncbi:MAG: hypothetical protein WBN92_07235 [Terriglobia bacterium]
MKTKNLLPSFLCLLLLLPALPFAAFAQTPSGTVNKASQNRYQIMRGTVEVFTQRALTVRDARQMYVVRTFSFNPKLLQKMQNRSYRKGDRVKVKYLRGSDVAVEVK